MIAPLAVAQFAAPVTVSELHAPYVRVQLPPAVDPGPAGTYADLRVRDARGRDVPYALDPHGTSTLPRSVAASTARREYPATAPGTERFTLDAGNAGVPIESVRIATRTPAFARDVRIETSDDGEAWTEAADDRITRFRGGRESTVVGVLGARGRYWRVTVVDGDDPPLADARVALVAEPHEIVFGAERGGRYTVYFGDPSLDAPSYDLPEVLKRDPRPEQPASLGRIVRVAPPPPAVSPPPAVARAAPADTGPPAVATAAFALAIAVLGLLALRLLRVR